MYICVYSEERKENKQVVRKANRGKNKKYSMKILYVRVLMQNGLSRKNILIMLQEYLFNGKYFSNFADVCVHIYEYWTEKVEIREKYTV